LSISSFKNTFKYFLVKSGIFIFLLLVIDRSLGAMITRYAQKQAIDKRIGMILNAGIDADLLVLGSSRAARNVVASELGDLSSVSAFNLGFPGSNIDFHAEILDLVVASGNAPKYLMLVVDPTEVIEDSSINFRFDVLYPYVGHHKVLEILCGRGQLDDNFSRLSAVYRVKHAFVEMFRPYNVFSRGVDPLNTTDPDGSMPVDGHSVAYERMTYKDSIVKYSQQRPESPALRARFSHVLSICRQRHIRLFIVFTPNYARPMEGLVERIRTLAGEEILLLDYSGNPEFIRKELYYDVVHLNREGALQLSRRIGVDLHDALTRN
jgi:hypothetical protein